MDGPPLTARRVRLRAVMPADYEYLYLLTSRPDVAWRWRYRGQMVPFDQFVHQLGPGTLAHFVVERLHTNERLGYLQAFDASERHGWCHIGAVLDPTIDRGGWTIEAPCLFLNYLFTTFNFRKVYAAVPEFNFNQFGNLAGDRFQVEARLEANEWHDGRWWDLVILAIYRRDWERTGPALVERITRPRVTA